jgi:oligopeptide transport system ATP-binding protein
MDSDAETLHVIEGVVPNPLHLPQGCRFHPRCPYVIDKCKETQPPLEQIGPGRWVACFLATDRLAKGVSA